MDLLQPIEIPLCVVAFFALWAALEVITFLLKAYTAILNAKTKRDISRIDKILETNRAPLWKRDD